MELLHLRNGRDQAHHVAEHPNTKPILNETGGPRRGHAGGRVVIVRGDEKLVKDDGEPRVGNDVGWKRSLLRWELRFEMNLNCYRSMITEILSPAPRAVPGR